MKTRPAARSSNTTGPHCCSASSATSGSPRSVANWMQSLSTSWLKRPVKQENPAMEEAVIKHEERGPVSVLTMQYRPYNLLGPTLLGAIADEIAAARDTGSRAIVLRSGLRHFSAGADVALFGLRIEQGGRSQSAIGGVDFLKLLELLPIPIVASVHGGGFELALACDYIVAASSAKI